VPITDEIVNICYRMVSSSSKTALRLIHGRRHIYLWQPRSFDLNVLEWTITFGVGAMLES